MHLFDHAIIEFETNKNGEELINIVGGNKLGKGKVHYNASTPHHAFVRETFNQANNNKANSFFEINNKPIKENNTVTCIPATSP